MKRIHAFTQTLFISGFLLLAAACSSAPVIQEFPSTANASEEVTRLQSDMMVATDNQVDALSPKNFNEAAESLSEAKASLDNQKDTAKTLHLVAEGRAYLARATDVATLCHSNIEDVIVARQQAIHAKAQMYTKEDFASADELLVTASNRVTSNDIPGARKMSPALQLAYLDLELRSIKASKLSPIAAIVQTAKKEGAAKFAPQSLAIAEKSLADADSYITGNRHDTAQINARTALASKNADHLLKITRNAKSGMKTSAEDQALQSESDKNQIVATKEQLGEKESQLATSNVANEAQAGQIAHDQNENTALAAKNTNLQASQDFNSRFEDARKQFKKSEAEVYKQGDTLVIRLRGLGFPVSKAELRGSDFALLAKVQGVINSMKSNSVLVEGHTDSMGTKAYNDRLSTERAEAVEKYLSANSQNPSIKFDAIGYGDQKPLASNKTASGRTQNRRVDVLIRPEALVAE